MNFKAIDMRFYMIYSMINHVNFCSFLKLYIMLRWTVIFLVIALIAGLLGFTGIAVGAAAFAKILFYIFLVLFLISLIGSFARKA